MRVLLPEPSDDVDIHAVYADGWLERGGVRVNFIASVDGAAAAQGKSAGLQTPGDNRVFAALRDLADVVLVGSGTATAEGYGAITLGEQRAAVREQHGLAAALPIAVTSRSLRLDPGSPLFAVDAPARTLVLTCASAPADRRAALAEVADLLDCGADDVEPARARAALERRGLTRILAEGGPTVFAAFAAAGVVDELCLTVSPMLAGPGAGRVLAGPEWAAARQLTLRALLEEDGALFLRYAVGR
ncbi:dihydrofolate reductase family protein [uncultured Jatrophihabitans sp.]|uniref:dihydrofolate reductase family protein n=1 Tax=uncultured Jatrophihabitans sp. TaxID=1610747 RepID=UPI0035C9EC8B